MKFVPKSAGPLVTKLAAVVPGGTMAELPQEAVPRALLLHWVRAPTTPQRVVTRSRIVLSALDGLSVDDIASRLDVSTATVRLWIARFEESGSEALLRDAPGRGRPAVIAPDEVRDRLREANLVRADGEPVSIRRAARFLGVSTSSLWRALRKGRRSA
jgi:transposase